MKQYTISGILAVILLGAALVSAGLGTGGVTAQGDPTPSSDLDNALKLAQDFSGDNTDWTPVIQEFDGVEMVLVPAGCFMMGSTEEEIAAIIAQTGFDWYEDEGPQHQVCFEAPFWIDRTEVSNGQFAAFSGQATQGSRFAEDDRPREKIARVEASDFCESRGGRLPTEAEWEYAARGPDGVVYPWGNMFDCQMGNYDDETKETKGVVEGGAGCDGFDGTAPVGSFPAGASWVGALDLGGNVSEWVADWYDAGYYATLADGAVNPTGPATGNMGNVGIHRGASWYESRPSFLRAAARLTKVIAERDISLGFRCVRSASN